jgi:predicted 3-demethylubiquinone-9 3-methyltransferase (glyoxalase superfamily)
MQKITPFLWFNNNAKEAADFYVSIFKNGHIKNVTPMMVSFELEGQEFIALNGGPQFTFTEAISLFVDCETQEEVDTLWAKLSEGGKEGRCGWLKDKYGLSWQIIPKTLGKLLSDSDPVKSQRVLQAMLLMDKINIAELQKAYEKTN